jgi:hypothetical protein
MECCVVYVGVCVCVCVVKVQSACRLRCVTVVHLICLVSLVISDLCPRWAHDGECSKNPAYVHIHCPQACGHSIGRCRVSVINSSRHCSIQSFPVPFLLIYVCLYPIQAGAR